MGCSHAPSDRASRASRPSSMLDATWRGLPIRPRGRPTISRHSHRENFGPGLRRDLETHAERGNSIQRTALRVRMSRLQPKRETMQATSSAIATKRGIDDLLSTMSSIQSSACCQIATLEAYQSHSDGILRKISRADGNSKLDLKQPDKRIVFRVHGNPCLQPTGTECCALECGEGSRSRNAAFRETGIAQGVGKYDVSASERTSLR